MTFTLLKGILIVITAAAVLIGGAVAYNALQQAQEPASPSQPPVIPAPSLPAPAEDETDDWKVYRNNEYGFEMRYPRHYGLLPGEENVIVSFYDEAQSEESIELNGGEVSYITVVVIDNKERLPLRAWFKENQTNYVGRPVNNDLFSSIQDILIDSASGLRFNVEGLGSPQYVLITQDNFIFELSTGLDANQYFDQVLSTFRFID